MGVWDVGTFEASPADSDSPGYAASQMRSERYEVRSRLDQEHVILNTGSTAAAVHRAGSAMAYYAAAASLPTLRPDGVTSLGVSGDTARLCIGSDNKALYYWDGSAWTTVVPLNLYTWHKKTTPVTGWLTSKTSGWTADSFSGGLTVDFTGLTLVGATAVRVTVLLTPNSNSGANAFKAYQRANGDTNVSNTPDSSSSYANLIGSVQNESNGTSWELMTTVCQTVLYLDASYKAQIAVSAVNASVFVSNPLEELNLWP